MLPAFPARSLPGCTLNGFSPSHVKAKMKSPGLAKPTIFHWAPLSQPLEYRNKTFHKHEPEIGGLSSAPRQKLTLMPAFLLGEMCPQETSGKHSQRGLDILNKKFGLE